MEPYTTSHNHAQKPVFDPAYSALSRVCVFVPRMHLLLQTRIM